MFGENGFLIGNEAFSSTSELGKTVLHEFYRLYTSSSACTSKMMYAYVGIDSHKDTHPFSNYY